MRDFFPLIFPLSFSPLPPSHLKYPGGFREREREREREWHGILFQEPNPRGSRPSDLIGLCRQYKKPDPPSTQGEARRARKPRPAKRGSGEGGEGAQGLHCGEANPGRPTAFIQEGNETPVSKATHSRYREGPVRPRVRR